MRKFADFLYGYNCCLLDLGGKPIDTAYFSDFVEDFYGLKKSPHKNWADIIEFFSDNKSGAIDLFLCHYTNFLESSYSKSTESGEVICQDEEKIAMIFPRVYLRVFRKRPAAYFGRKSLKRMMSFFDGYMFCLQEKTGKEQEFLSGFQEFVEGKYGTKSNPSFNHHWLKLIEFFSPDFNGDESFDEFFTLYDEFAKNKN